MKKKYFIIGILLFFVSILLISKTVAFFSVINRDGTNTVVTSTKTLALNHEGCENLIIDGAVPGTSITCDFKVTNAGNKMLIYDYDLVDVVNDFSIRDDLVYTISKNGVEIGHNLFPTEDIKLSIDNCLEPQQTDTYTLTVSYLLQEYNQNADMGKTASGKVNVTNAEEATSCRTRIYDVVVDPNGGSWQDYENPQVLNAESGGVIDLSEDPVYEGYEFKGWSLSANTVYKNKKITVYHNVTATAIWDVSEDCVARINDRYFLTLEKAHEKATNGDTITMIKNTTETVTMTKNVTLDLNGYTITGEGTSTITNEGILTIIGNGEIINNTDKAIINNGELTLGSNDETVSITDPHIYGKNLGIEQNNLFNFYDGIIIGITGCIGTYDLLPENYYVFVNRNDETGNQEVYLVNVFTTRAIARIDKVLYMNLQDAIDLNAEQDTINFIRDCELAYPITNNADDTTMLDLSGYNVESGYAIINNGNLTITDTGSERGSWNNSVTVTNNNFIVIKNVKMNSTTNNAVLTNYKTMNVENATITGKTGYGIFNSGVEKLTIDSDSIIKSESTYGINNYDRGYITGDGTIYGIIATSSSSTQDNETVKLTIDGPNVIGTNNINGLRCENHSYVNMINGSITAGGTSDGTVVTGYSTFVMDNGVITNKTSAYSMNINNYSNVTINDGEVIANVGGGISNVKGNLNINGGNFSGNGVLIYSTNFTTINDGTFTSNAWTCIDAPYERLTIKNGTFNNPVGRILNVPSTQVVIYNGSFISKGTVIEKNNAQGVTIYDGYFESTDANAVNLTYGSSNILGGTFKSLAGYGLYYSTTWVGNTLNIGSNDGTVNNTPIFIGKTYGLYRSGSGIFNLYDGIFKGQTKGLTGTINALASGYAIFEGTEVINDVTYNTAYLDYRPPYLQVDDTTYNVLSEALLAANNSSSKTVKLIKEEEISEVLSIPSGYDVTFDLNGYTATFTLNNEVYGKLTIDDTSEAGTGNFVQSGYYGMRVYSNAKLTINNGTFYGIDGLKYFIFSDYQSNVNIVINDGIFYVKNDYIFLYASDSNSNLTINNGYFESFYNNKLIYSNLTTIINNATMIGYGNPPIYQNGNSLTINDGTYSGQYGIEVHGATLNANGGTYSGTTYGLRIQGSLNIKNATINNGLSLVNATANINEGAIINNTNGYGIHNYRSTANIYGGTITSTNSAGIYGENNPVINIGNNDGNVSITSPVIMGKTYGILHYGTLYFYDGIVKSPVTSISGTINLIPLGYEVKNDTEEIDSVINKISYLQEKTNFLAIDDQEYNTFAAALADIPTNGTITTIRVLNSASIKEEIKIAEGSNVVLDLNGYSLSNTQRLINNGDLLLTDSSELNTGVYSSSASNNVITNNKGTLNVSNLAINASIGDSYVINNASTGIVNINSGKVINSSNSIAYVLGNGSTGTINVYDGTFSNRYILYNYSGYINIFGGTFNATESIGDVRGTIVINGGTFTANSIFTNRANMTINGGEFNARGTSSCMMFNLGTLVINNGVILSHNSNDNTINNSGYLLINNANIIATGTGAAIKNTSGGNIVALNGVIEGKYSYGIVNNATLTIGKNDDSVSINQPIIMGKLYGVYGNLNFYDGILKGQTSGYSGVINELPTNYDVTNSVEVINELNYDTRYLISAEPFIEISEKTYTNLQTAIDEATPEDTIKVIANGSTYYDITINTDDVINLDLNGYTLTANNPITNNGTLIINDTTIEQLGKVNASFSSSDIPLIINYGNFTLNSGNLNAALGVINYNDNIININDGSINSYYEAIKNMSNGSLIISGGEVTSNVSNAIDNYSPIELIIKNATINSHINALKNNSVSKITLQNANINGAIYIGHCNTINFNNVEMDVTDVSVSNIINNNYGANIVLDNLVITGTSTKTYASNIINNDGGTITGTKMTIETNKNANTVQSANFIVINNNNGAIDLEELNVTLNQNYFYYNSYGVYNDSNKLVTIDKFVFNGTISVGNPLYGIYTTGSGNVVTDEITFNIDSSNDGANVYGLYNNGAGYFLAPKGTINITGKGNSYGIYNNGSGGVVIGLQDGNVSTSIPTINVLTTGTAIGVKKENGYIEYYDGIIKGKTNAKPETTSLVEPGYEVAFYRDEDDIEYCILEYMTD